MEEEVALGETERGELATGARDAHDDDDAPDDDDAQWALPMMKM